MKKSLSIVCMLLCCALLQGCWDYQGLRTIDIVTGVAIDKDPDTGLYLLTYEIVNTQASGKDDAIKVNYIESEGETLFDAIRHAKRRLINKLYGGNMQTLIISRQIAEEEGVLMVLEMWLRDGEPRETLSVAISQEETAKSVLTTKGMDSNIIAFEIHETILEDNQTTSSTKNVALYQAYNAIKEPGSSLVLPVMHIVKNNKDSTTESNGVALFRGNKLIGFLSPKQTLNYLFIVDEVRGGAFSFTPQNANSKVSMEIKKSSSKTNVRYVDGQLIVSIKIQTEMKLTELKAAANLDQAQERDLLEKSAAQAIEDSVRTFFGFVQTEYQSDVLGLGRKMFEDHLGQWLQLEGDWDELFSNAQLEVEARVKVLDTGDIDNF